MKLTLYQFEQCPYCAKVRAWLDEHGKEYAKVNVANDRDDPQRKELAEKSGVATVPVLKVENDGTEIYIGESADIIAWLESS